MPLRATVQSKVISSVATAALCAIAGAAASAQQQAAPALRPEAALSLPRPDFRFEVEVGHTYLDSDPATFPQIVRPSEGAPNIVLILGVVPADAKLTPRSATRHPSSSTASSAW
jgi:arylsulfatase